MSKETPLPPLEQRLVDFYDDQIVVVKMVDGTVFVPVRPICRLLGVDWDAQRRRIQRDLILADEAQGVVVMTPPSADGRGGGQQTMTALPLDYLNGWLFGINASRVKPEIKETLLRYQREVYRVLADAFGRNMVTARPDTQIMESDSPAALAYRNALEVANLARQQFYLEQRIESAELTITDNLARLDAIEAQLGDASRYITVGQSEQLSQAVRAVGLVFSKTTGRNEYGGVYGELYRRYGVNSYKRLPTAKFDEAMNWLRTWYEDLTDSDTAPF